MRRLNTRKTRIAGLLALALGAVALLALSGGAAAKDRRGDDHGHHGRHHHHRHFREMHEAGTISTFDATTGKLTIALTGGETVTGLVTEETRIRCEGFADTAVDNRLQRRDHGGGDDNGGQFEPGDDHGGRGDEPGDDNGGHGNEPGDDNGGDNSGSGSSGSSGGPEGSPNCTTASLVPGAFVAEAELRLGTGAAVFTEVELGHDS